MRLKVVAGQISQFGAKIVLAEAHDFRNPPKPWFRFFKYKVQLWVCQ
jgi:hypothetical protein